MEIAISDVLQGMLRTKLEPYVSLVSVIIVQFAFLKVILIVMNANQVFINIINNVYKNALKGIMKMIKIIHVHIVLTYVCPAQILYLVMNA